MTSTDVHITAATDSLPLDLGALAAEAAASGINNVGTLVERWRDGSERYDRRGESMLLARLSDDSIVGVGGIAQCRDVPEALRVRRFYVSTSARRLGIARRLAATLIESGFGYTDTLTCNARASDAAPPFWESMGFQPVDIAGITHQLTRPSA